MIRMIRIFRRTPENNTGSHTAVRPDQESSIYPIYHIQETNRSIIFNSTEAFGQLHAVKSIRLRQEFTEVQPI